jgi:hypothetical protein
MDEIVAEAMRKWPNVPDVYGWLGLDRRGNWLLKGERIGNEALRAFIDRNYMHDDEGRWYFQNGPQRVFVTLAATPFIYSLEIQQGILVARAHTGVPANEVSEVWLVDASDILLVTELGPGLVIDRDLAIAMDTLCDANGAPLREVVSLADESLPEHLMFQFGAARMAPGRTAFSELAARFQFITEPS